jgi:hypothetical protein
MKFEVDMRTFIPKNKINIFVSGWFGKPQISYFSGPPLGGPCAAPKTLGRSFQDFQENSLSSMLVLSDNRSFTKFDLEL